MIDEQLLANMWDAQNQLNKNTIEMITDLQKEVNALKRKLHRHSRRQVS